MRFQAYLINFVKIHFCWVPVASLYIPSQSFIFCYFSIETNFAPSNNHSDFYLWGLILDVGAFPGLSWTLALKEVKRLVAIYEILNSKYSETDSSKIAFDFSFSNSLLTYNSNLENNCMTTPWNAVIVHFWDSWQALWLSSSYLTHGVSGDNYSIGSLIIKLRHNLGQSIIW